MDFDYFVFSSHKTGTQSIVNTLRGNGQKAIHLHTTRNLDLSLDLFRDNLAKRKRERREKPKIITNFRLPVERHVSSFFQWYGTGVLKINKNLNVEDTIISSYSISELNKAFISDLEKSKLVGYKESIHEIFDIFSLKPSDLTVGFLPHSYQVNHELADIYFFRYDELFKDFVRTLSSVLQIELAKENRKNISSEKWYHSKFFEFKNNFQIPGALIEKTYEYRKNLIDIFYPNSYETLMKRDIQTYGFR